MSRVIDSGGRRRAVACIAGAALAGLVLLTACGGGTGAQEPAGTSTAAIPTGSQPQPLAEPTTLTVAMGSKTEIVATLLLADALGEFAKENLTVDLVPITNSSDAIQALAQGKVDVASAGVGAKPINAVLAGSDVRLVFPGATRNPTDGLYVARDPQTGTPKPIERLATPGGPAVAYIVPITRYLESVGQDIGDVEIDLVEPPEVPDALASGAFEAAWVNAPVTQLLDETGEYERVIGYEDGEYGLGYLFGPNLLRDRPEVGQAFVRAMTRTARDHLGGDYKQDDDLVETLATVLETTPETVRATPSMTFGSGLPTDAIQRGQDIWIALGDILQSETPVPAETYADPSFVERAVG